MTKPLFGPDSPPENNLLKRILDELKAFKAEAARWERHQPSAHTRQHQLEKLLQNPLFEIIRNETGIQPQILHGVEGGKSISGQRTNPNRAWLHVEGPSVSYGFVPTDKGYTFVRSINGGDPKNNYFTVVGSSRDVVFDANLVVGFIAVRSLKTLPTREGVRSQAIDIMINTIAGNSSLGRLIL